MAAHHQAATTRAVVAVVQLLLAVQTLALRAVQVVRGQK
jgi:hypothetical protein